MVTQDSHLQGAFRATILPLRIYDFDFCFIEHVLQVSLYHLSEKNQGPLFIFFVVSTYSKKHQMADFVPEFRCEKGMCAQIFCVQMIEGDLKSILDETKVEFLNS